jgi:hypothetical protein
MSKPDLLTLIDTEIASLQQVRTLMTGRVVRGPKGLQAETVKPKKKKRKMSPEGRARIAAAQKARWAAQKKAAK